MNDHTIDYIAHVAHEINRAYCQATGDNSQPTWDEAPEWQKASARNGVKFHVEHPGSEPAASHENWAREKISAGWVYGSVKNPDAKPPTHPCLMPYDELPLEQRVKDYLFIGVVRVLTEIYS